MAGVDAGGGGGRGKRAMNGDINMIPFIDLLMVTVAFLLITAVWVTNAQIKANARVPASTSELPPTPVEQAKVLDLSVYEGKFVLAWKVGADVVSTRELERPKPAGDVVRYDELARTIEAEWKLNGSHKDPSDPELDTALLHTDNATPFKEIVAVMDALYATRRDRVTDEQGNVEPASAFNMTFAVR